MTEDQSQIFKRFTDIMSLTERPFVCMDLLRLVFEDKISEGEYRAVYDFALIPGTVIKATLKTESNLMEWAVWEDVKNTPAYAKWFAPCIDVSPAGHFLIMKKVEPIPEGYKMPKTMPSFFTDLKKSNFGLLDGNLVCVDYQFIATAMDTGMTSKRSVKWK